MSNSRKQHNKHKGKQNDLMHSYQLLATTGLLAQIKQQEQQQKVALTEHNSNALSFRLCFRVEYKTWPFFHHC